MKKLSLIVLGLAFAANASAESDHWAFQPISAPDGSIDEFVDAKLAAAGLKMSQRAEPHTLLRRLHLDLTGLLPTLDEMDAFNEAWARDPDAAIAEKVRQLLDSPHFGEQWGRHWLDLARYADSDGYLGDNLRPWAWVYRDWVIDSINRDQPFDQFSIEQLAGDLIPEASQSQKIATGFHRNNLNNTEAGADRELNRTKQIVDRVGVTGSVWLGLTLACAECHDHKHDPISQREFFQFYAFFNNTNDADISVLLPGEKKAHDANLAAWEKRLEELEKALGDQKPNRIDPPEDEIWNVLQPDKFEAASTDFELQEDGSLIASSSKLPSTVSYFVETPIAETTILTGFRLEVFGEFGEGREQGKPVGRGPNGEFVVSIFIADWIDANGKAKRMPLKSAKADHFDEQDAMLSLDYPNTKGWRVATATFQDHTAVFELAKPTEIPAGTRIKFSIGQKFGTGNSMRQFRLSATTKTGPFEPDEAKIDAEFASLRLPIEKHLSEKPQPPASKAQTLVERGSNDRRESFVHVRGDYARQGEAVEPGVLAILHPLETEGKANRLALANWLFDDRNPLTARVAANRIWRQLMGEGIVATPDDFGTRGATPTHPQLLDFLATRFRELGWSRKELIREIVLSRAYQQSSLNSNPDLPNDLLWRQNSFRVSAENVRDIHLLASGLLEPKIGGPGIRPPLPEFVSAVGRSVKWPVSEGGDRYRRGTYIFLKRTVLYPQLTAFDAPDTSQTCSRRERTNTPMQALTLLNDPVFFECAETLGRDLDAKHGENVEAAIRDLVRRCLNRDPAAAELETLKSAHRDFLASGANRELAMTATSRIVMNLDEFVTRD